MKSKEKKYKLLHELIDKLEDFENETSGNAFNMVSFSFWLKDNVTKNIKGDAVQQKDFSIKQDYTKEQSYEAHISSLISELYKYAKSYAKKAMNDSEIKTLDEFGFLATLMVEESFTKTEIISRHLLEITSGTEILKRLNRSGYIEEFSDENDKRSKRVRITPQGQRLMFTLFEEMNKAAHIITGDLSEKEKETLLNLLLRLKNFHQLVHHEDRKSELDEIINKYLFMN